MVRFPSTLNPGWLYSDLPPLSFPSPFPFPQRFPISNTCPPTTTLQYRLYIVRYSNANKTNSKILSFKRHRIFRDQIGKVQMLSSASITKWRFFVTFYEDDIRSLDFAWLTYMFQPEHQFADCRFALHFPMVRRTNPPALLESLEFNPPTLFENNTKRLLKKPEVIKGNFCTLFFLWSRNV
jgi:hypothetical protein